MKILKIVLFSMIVVGLIATSGFAGSKMEGNAEKGKMYFDEPKFAGGSVSCSSCHPGGKGLEKSAAKKEWKNPSGMWLKLEDAINVCIIMANKGKTIDPKSEDMKDLVAYIKSLSKPMTKGMKHEMGETKKEEMKEETGKEMKKEMPKKEKAPGY
ncbi:MAG: hypothetical protein HY755_03900 [Nitrospirae bacterium]|nr:hypothetical protein [Nitrospirota bacterium]MBI4847241.1 hypothetical protein [Nitrospirota bacterium]